MSQIYTNTIDREAPTFQATQTRKQRRKRYLACNRKNGQFATFGDQDFAQEWVDENGGMVLTYNRLSELPTWVVVRCMENVASVDGTMTDAVHQLGVATTVQTLRKIVGASYAAYNRAASAHNAKHADAPLPLLGVPKLPIGDELATDDIAAIFASDDASDDA